MSGEWEKCGFLRVKLSPPFCKFESTSFPLSTQEIHALDHFVPCLNHRAEVGTEDAMQSVVE